MSFKIELINEKIIEIKEEQTILQASLEQAFRITMPAVEMQNAPPAG